MANFKTGGGSRLNLQLIFYTICQNGYHRKLSMTANPTFNKASALSLGKPSKACSAALLVQCLIQLAGVLCYEKF